MLGQFTDRARKVLVLANKEARRLNHEYVNTEHVLLGLLEEGSGVGANVLKNLGVDLDKVRLEIEKLIEPGPDMITMGNLPHTPRVKKVFEHAIEESRDLNHSCVGTEHLLLGLAHLVDSVAGRVLASFGLSLEQLREEALNLLGCEVTTDFVHITDAIAFTEDDADGATPGAMPALMEHLIKRVIQEADPADPSSIGPEHVLLALLSEPSGRIEALLNQFGVTRGKLIEAIRRLPPPNPT